MASVSGTPKLCSTRRIETDDDDDNDDGDVTCQCSLMPGVRVKRTDDDSKSFVILLPLLCSYSHSLPSPVSSW